MNICFESNNITSLSDTNCVPALVELLSQENKEVLTAAVGALQSIVCFNLWMI